MAKNCPICNGKLEKTGKSELGEDVFYCPSCNEEATLGGLKILGKIGKETTNFRRQEYKRAVEKKGAQKQINKGVERYVEEDYTPGTTIATRPGGKGWQGYRFIGEKKKKAEKSEMGVPAGGSPGGPLFDSPYPPKEEKQREERFAPGIPSGGPINKGPLYEYEPPAKKNASQNLMSIEVLGELVKRAVDLTNIMPETKLGDLWKYYRKDPYVDRVIRTKAAKESSVYDILRSVYNKEMDADTVERLTGSKIEIAKKKIPWIGGVAGTVRTAGYTSDYKQRAGLREYMRPAWRKAMGFEAKPGVEGGEAREKSIVRSAMNRGRVLLRRRAFEIFKENREKLQKKEDKRIQEAEQKFKTSKEALEKILKEFQKAAQPKTGKGPDVGNVMDIGAIMKGAEGGEVGMALAGAQAVGGILQSGGDKNDAKLAAYYTKRVEIAENDLKEAREEVDELRKLQHEKELLDQFSADLKTALEGQASEISASIINEYSNYNLPEDAQHRIETALKGEADWLTWYFTNKLRGRILRRIPALGMSVRGLSMGSQTLGDVWNDVIGNLWSFLTGPWVLGGFVSFALFWMILTWSQNAAVVIAMASIGAAGVFFLNISNTKQPLDWLTHIISGWMIGSSAALFLISLLGPDTIWNMSWGFVGAPFPFWLLWVVLALFIGAFQIYSTGGYRMVFQITVLIMLFTYVALGPYSGYYQQFIKPVRTAVGEIASTIGSAFGELWLLSTNPTKWYELQQLRNVQAEKPFDRPKGVEITQLEALPPSVPASTEDDTQHFSIIAVYRNEGDLDAKDIEFHIQCNEPQYCNANDSKVSEDHDTELLTGEGSVVEFTGLTSYIPIEGREAEFRVAEAQINLTYTYSTNSSLKVTVMNKEEISRRQREGEDLFQPRKATAKNTPAKISINVGPQPLPTDTERTLLVNVINTRDDGSVFLRQRSLLIVTLPNSIGSGLVCPESLGCTTETIGNKERSICLIPKDIKIPPNKYTETNAAFLCRFKTASAAEVGVERTDVVTAELPDYGFIVEKKVEITINPPLGILDNNINLPGGSGESSASAGACPATISNAVDDYNKYADTIDAALAKPENAALSRLGSLEARALVAAFIHQESGWTPNALSQCGAAGMMQFIPGTAIEYGLNVPTYACTQGLNGCGNCVPNTCQNSDRSGCDLANDERFNDRKNIEAGIRYISRILEPDYCDGKIPCLVSAYMGAYSPAYEEKFNAWKTPGCISVKTNVQASGWPVQSTDKNSITGCFANTEAPYSENHRHAGLDIGGTEGVSKIFSVTDGTVKICNGWPNNYNHADCWAGYGNHVIVTTGNTIIYYGHMKEIDPGLQDGQQVHKDTPLGTLGSTGDVTGPHLHIEFRDTSITPPAGYSYTVVDPCQRGLDCGNKCSAPQRMFCDATGCKIVDVVLSGDANYCRWSIDNNLGKCVYNQGGCANNDECLTPTPQGSQGQLKCKSIPGASVKVCCYATGNDTQCSNDFNTWKNS